MRSRSFVRSLTLAAALPISSFAQATDPVPVRIEAKCPDKTLEYQLSLHAISEIHANKSYKLVNDGSAATVIRFSGAPVKASNDALAPLGISIAWLVVNRDADGNWSIKRFNNSFVPIDKIESTVKEAVKDALK